MSWLKAIPILGSVIEKALGIVDEDVEDKDKANELKTKIKASILDKLALEWQHITARWVVDNDHLITRLVRPLSYGYVWILFTVVIFLDSFLKTFSLKPEYIDIIKAILVTMTWAYFGGRSLEKITRIFKGGEKQ